MQSIEVTLENIVQTLGEFYVFDKHHFVGVNGIDTKDGMTVQWVFAEYGKKQELTVFAAHCDYNELIPSVSSVIPSAWTSEAELAELFGITVEGSKGGFMLEEDSPKAPLRKTVGEAK